MRTLLRGDWNFGSRRFFSGGDFCRDSHGDIILEACSQKAARDLNDARERPATGETFLHSLDSLEKYIPTLTVSYRDPGTPFNILNTYSHYPFSAGLYYLLVGKPPKVLGQFHVTLPAFVPQVPHFPVLSRIIQVESCQINVKSTVVIACHSQSSSVPSFLGFTPFITILLPQFPHSFVLTRADTVTSLQLTIISPINTPT